LKRRDNQKKGMGGKTPTKKKIKTPALHGSTQREKVKKNNNEERRKRGGEPTTLRVVGSSIVPLRKKKKGDNKRSGERKADIPTEDER